MSGPYCKTCFYFDVQPLGDQTMGECHDPAKCINDRGGDTWRNPVEVHESCQCNNWTSKDHPTIPPDEATARGIVDKYKRPISSSAMVDDRINHTFNSMLDDIATAIAHALRERYKEGFEDGKAAR